MTLMTMKKRIMALKMTTWIIRKTRILHDANDAVTVVLRPVIFFFYIGVCMPASVGPSSFC